MSNKRGREEEWQSETTEALQELGSALRRGRVDQKLRAMEQLAALVAPADDVYAVQKAVVDDEDASFYLLELLQDESGAVQAGAARLVERLARHSAEAAARLAVGPLVGLESAPERLRLNPVQSQLVEDGLLAPLARLVLSGAPELRDAGAGAVAALCSYNRDAKLAYLEELVQALLVGDHRVLELVDAVLDGMDCSGEDLAGLLDGLVQPVLSTLRAPRGDAPGALSLLATLCEKRPELKEDFWTGGAPQSVASLLQHGEIGTQDLAARALWLLVEGKSGELGPSGGVLAGLDPRTLASALLNLVQIAQKEEEEEAEHEDDVGSSAPRRWEEGPSDWDAGAPAEPAGTADVCYAEEARQLLAALAEHYPAVTELAEQQNVEVAAGKPSATGCCLM